MSLKSTAAGEIRNSIVTIATGDLEFDVSFKVKVNGGYLLGSSPLTLSFASSGTTQAEYSSSEATLTISRAPFNLGDGQMAVLNTE